MNDAPELVRKCLQSWQDANPDWDFRCLDSTTIARYVDLSSHVDLTRQQITAASLSDILRLLLLHEYGGVWVDATTFCNTPLDNWLEQASHTGFFAFSRPSEDREIATWFLAAESGHRLLSKWTANALAYWRDRSFTRDYFWAHHQFGELVAMDREAFADWQAVPKISADGPHSVQSAGLYTDFDAAREHVDWSAPLFKLTHRYEPEQTAPNTLLARLLAETTYAATPSPLLVQSSAPVVANLCVGTENLGDHIQIIAAEQTLARAGLGSSFRVDRDDEIANPPQISNDVGAGILLNGWFKTNPSQWPPHPNYVPIYLGFHIRLFQAPSLVSPAALEHYRQHGPIGCRDRYTLSLLRSHGVEAFLSHCLTMTLPRRLLDPDNQNEVFVVSRDQRILNYLPDSLGPYTFLSHYSNERDFESNMDAAREILETYRTRARLIVTTMLHAALPAIAMGIPVVVFYPYNNEAARKSDRQRFSSLSDIVRVFELSETNIVDWRGYCPDVSNIKLQLIDSFLTMAQRWGTVDMARVSGIAPASVLPPPDHSEDYSYFNDPERLQRLAIDRTADRLKWGARSSYLSDGKQRGALAATFVGDGERVLEIGSGVGSFRDILANRCQYTGADLAPIDSQFLVFNLESDPIPSGPWDTVVMLGVVEYLYEPAAALTKVLGETQKLVMSYCFPLQGGGVPTRRNRGWVNDLDEAKLTRIVHASGFKITTSTIVNREEDFEQKIFLCVRKARWKAWW